MTRSRRPRFLAAAVLSISASSLATLPAAAQDVPVPSVPMPVAPTLPPLTLPSTTALPALTVPQLSAVRLSGPAALAALLPGRSALPTTAELSAGYQGLTAAYAALYAKSANQSLETWYAQNAQVFASALAAPSLATLPAPSSPAAFQANLQQVGAAADTTAQLATYALDVQRDPLSALVFSSAYDFAGRLGTMRAPDFPRLDITTPALVTERAVAVMATEFPDLIAQVQASGQLSPSAQTAWDASMRKAAASTLKSSNGLSDPCQAAMIWAMGSGSAASARGLGSGCGSCVAQGLYLHRQFAQVMSPSAPTAVIPPADINAMPAHRRAAIARSNPQVFATPPLSVTAPAGCSTGSAAASTVLSGALAQLSK
jgi:hypothetical protein